MALDLPKPIASYFAADKENSEAIARCFTADAVVKDEGHTYAGVAEIRRWKEETSSKFTYTNEPFALDRNDGQIMVTSRVTGNFPGSPIDLRFIFGLAGDRIASLEIIP